MTDKSEAQPAGDTKCNSEDAEAARVRSTIIFPVRAFHSSQPGTVTWQEYGQRPSLRLQSAFPRVNSQFAESEQRADFRFNIARPAASVKRSAYIGAARETPTFSNAFRSALLPLYYHVFPRTRLPYSFIYKYLTSSLFRGVYRARRFTPTPEIPARVK
jgi:hypothetical protein